MRLHATPLVLALALILTLVLLVLAPKVAGAAEPEAGIRLALADTLVVTGTRDLGLEARAKLLRDPPPLPLRAGRHADPFVISVELVPRPEPVRLNRFQCSIQGADRGANTGLFLGKIGDWLGFWDEETAFVIMGAGAAAGAILGATAQVPEPEP